MKLVLKSENQSRKTYSALLESDKNRSVMACIVVNFIVMQKFAAIYSIMILSKNLKIPYEIV